MAGNELGKIAGKWLKAKVTELTTTDNRARDDAQGNAEQLERNAQAAAVEQAVYAAAPGLREFKEKQEAARIARDVREAEEREAELRARPLAGVGLRLSGAFDGEMAVTLPTSAVIEPPEAGSHDAEADDGYADEYVDPYADRPTLVIRISSFDDTRPWLGPHQFNEWAVFVPGYHGDGTYDLAAIHREREAATMAPDYLDWYLSVDDAEEDWFFDAYADAPATVTVADEERSVTVQMPLAGAGGQLTASASIRLS